MPEQSRGAGVRLRNLTKRYAGVAAVDDVSLDIHPGELISLLGPSGSGKTTTMMAIGGFVDDLAGEILFDDRPVGHLPPEHRHVGVVFQHLALFPHMTVADNIAYPLRMRGMAAAEIRSRVDRVLALVKLAGFGARMPAELSGGQQQRVAFARAIVFEPKILLLDEPLAALDKKLREEMQREIRSLHRQLGVTIVHVTHDQLEALSISDRIVVMNHGRIEHVGTPIELYTRPGNRFVADFIGDSAILAGTVARVADGMAAVKTRGGLEVRASAEAGVTAGDRVELVIRPENVRIDSDGRAGSVAGAAFQGDRIRYEVALNDHDAVIALAPAGVPAALGAPIAVTWDVGDVRLFRAAPPQ